MTPRPEQAARHGHRRPLRPGRGTVSPRLRVAPPRRLPRVTPTRLDAGLSWVAFWAPRCVRMFVLGCVFVCMLIEISAPVGRIVIYRLGIPQAFYFWFFRADIEDFLW